ncbi:helix-turn-helix domain-containing protein [Mucilaginibacter phyllosphaerae]|uniref:AraC family transcriptional regulator n=1 Tax=Mucilaginibacter phyllosphaerae TaxID=1812349 RepID=A0A4Y8A7U3_9SPHI|nr:helix-turn-helix domain-containing protein [Mucilaginibacter phyllosphaerae]MBB3971128.1 AraC-like DNA-binding protein [Mucilaginibacter phyllosphaerae]TEW63858.1 AraC family transcriptional regulator [Mucilaginibacter phyllosphaerae]GGH22642.1 AraC family transcriptional regulator [Mucilaginibacter phyllosphaerae]
MSKKIAQLSFPKFVDLYADKSIGADFFITEEKHLLALSEYPYRSDGYIIGICTRGTARVEVNLQVYDARPNAMLLATPFHVLRIYDSSEDFLCRFVVFSKSFLTENNINSHFLESFSYFNSSSTPVIYPDHEKAKVILEVFVLIKNKLLREEHPYKTEICRSILATLLYEVAAVYEHLNVIIKNKQTRKQELNIRFQNLVFHQYKEHRNVQHYADTLCVSPKHLTESIKEVTGKTAGEWIDDAVILEAKVLLRNYEISIARIAEAIHFPDQSSFGKYFKKQTGLSPSEYRVKANS